MCALPGAGQKLFYPSLSAFTAVFFAFEGFPGSFPHWHLFSMVLPGVGCIKLIIGWAIRLAGKDIWRDVNEAFYNDYVIYGSQDTIDEDRENEAP